VILKNGIIKTTYRDRVVSLRVLVEGYEEKGKFISVQVWVNQMDLENLGILDIGKVDGGAL
jgi:hypothetical protein